MTQRRHISVFEANFLHIKKLKLCPVDALRPLLMVKPSLPSSGVVESTFPCLLLRRAQHHQPPPLSIFRVLGEALCIAITFSAGLHATSSGRDDGREEVFGGGVDSEVCCCSDEYRRGNNLLVVQRKFRLTDEGRGGRIPVCALWV